MKLRGMYCLSSMETAQWLGEPAQAAHDWTTTSGDVPWPERIASDACAQHLLILPVKGYGE